MTHHFIKWEENFFKIHVPSKFTVFIYIYSSLSFNHFFLRLKMTNVHENFSERKFQTIFVLNWTKLPKSYIKKKIKNKIKQNMKTKLKKYCIYDVYNMFGDNYEILFRILNSFQNRSIKITIDHCDNGTQITMGGTFSLMPIIAENRICNLSSNPKRGCPSGVMVKAKDCGIVVSEFELQ